MTILASLRTGSRRLEERKGIASVKAGSQNQAGSPTGWFLARGSSRIPRSFAALTLCIELYMRSLHVICTACPSHVLILPPPTTWQVVPIDPPVMARTLCTLGTLLTLLIDPHWPASHLRRSPRDHSRCYRISLCPHPGQRGIGFGGCF